MIDPISALAAVTACTSVEELAILQLTWPKGDNNAA